MTITQFIPLDADDLVRDAMTEDFAAFVVNLQDSGMEPVVDIEPTSSGDVYIVTAGCDEPAAVADPRDLL
jgi:hypothetical protein